MTGLDLGAILPGGGLAGAVITLLIWIQKVAREDRKEYKEQVKAERDRLAEIEKNHGFAVADLERRLGDARTVVDGEHERRRDLEIEAEKLRMQASMNQTRLEWLTAELSRRGSANYPPHTESAALPGLTGGSAAL